jgi:hypothetical protein
VISIVLATSRLFAGLWLTGLGSMGLLLFTLFNFLSNIDRFREQMKAGAQEAGPFSGLAATLADLTVNSVQIQWGWAVLLLGSILIVLAAAIRSQSKPPILVRGPSPGISYNLDSSTPPNGLALGVGVLLVSLLMLMLVPSIRHRLVFSISSSQEQKQSPKEGLATSPIDSGNHGNTTSLRYYKNDRFGFSIRYPSLFRPSRSPENGDGQEFRTKDGIILSLVGANLDPGDSLATEERSALDEVPGATVQGRSRSSFALTWGNKTEIGARIEYVGSACRNTLTLRIPGNNGLRNSRDGRFYERLVQQLFSSFQPGDLENAQ